VRIALWDFKGVAAGLYSPIKRLFDHLCRAGDALLDLVFPPRCVVGGELLDPSEVHLCEACIGKIDRIGSPLCSCCGRPFFTPDDDDHLCGVCIDTAPPFDIARAFGVYGGVLLDVIHLFKYRRRAYLSGILSGLMARGLGAEARGFDVLVPVPLHKRRLYQRGYNQASLLCRGLGRAWGLPVDYTSLIRERWTEPQVRLTPSERIKNVRGAFSVADGPENPLRDKRILLVDDVYTTGATVSECARVLKRAGAESVGVLTLARVVIK
jgi:ComF family protein